VIGAPYHLEPDDFWDLQFGDFPGGDIGDVASVLYHREPQFMRALEADVRESGVLEPVELGAGDTIKEGHHRVAATHRAGVPVPVVFYGELYGRDEAEHARWDSIRARHPEEYTVRMNHDPYWWDALPGAGAQRGREAGQ
jgi:hypothetical protein